MNQLVRVLYQDPFSPKLVSPMSVALPVSDEQKMYVRKILDKSCSDSQFSSKAYAAITQVLTGGYIKVPAVTSLTPSSAEIGDPSFTIHVHGTNFTNTSKIIFNGYEEPTTFVSATEVTTGVNMSVWAAPAVLPVGVQSEDGLMSNTMNFEFTDGTIQTALKSPVQKVGPITPAHKDYSPTLPGPGPVGYNPPTHLLNKEEDKK